jgi:hypothetical protein
MILQVLQSKLEKTIVCVLNADANLRVATLAHAAASCLSFVASSVGAVAWFPLFLLLTKIPDKELS